MEKKELEAIVAHYEGYDEDARFNARWCRVEYLTTMRYIHRYLRPGDRVLELGAGTGRYSLALAGEGFDVTAVELVERNLAVLRAGITPGMRLQALQGNALDLSALPSETYDLTLLLGPLYHLLTEADKRRALAEALRVTKPGGVLMAAWCVTDGPMINFTFRLDRYKDLTESGMLDPETWRFHPEKGFLFEHVTRAEIDRLMAGFPVDRLHYVATDGLLSFLQKEMEEMDEETFQALLRYHFTVCEREDLIGATAHSLDVMRKR
jgi:SAM-dependent methyltransferase